MTSTAKVQQLVNKALKLAPSEAQVADPGTATAINLLGVQTEILGQSILELSSLEQADVQSLINQASADQWEADAQPPAGTRATPYFLKLPDGWQSAKLKTLTYWNAIAPTGGAETLTLRIYKYLADGSAFFLMTDPLVVNNTFSSFVTVDVSSYIRDLYWAPGDVLALSRVYANPNTLQAPLIQWTFELANNGDGITGTPISPAVWPPV